MKVPNIIVFLLLLLAACKTKEEERTILYNEDKAFVISAHLPAEWYNYPDIHHHFDEPGDFLDAIGNKDTSALLVVSISGYKRDTTEDLSAARLLDNVVTDYPKEFTSVDFLRKEILINKMGKHIGIVAVFLPADLPDTSWYNETIVFSNGKKVCKLMLMVKNDKQHFSRLAYDLERSVTF